MRERVEIPEAHSLNLVERKIALGGSDVTQRRDFLDEDVAPMPVFGRGLKAHVTSSCHDEHGMRNLSDPDVMHRYVTKPIEKILKHRDDIIQVEADCEGADLVLVSYGSVGRSAKAAALLAQAEGLKVGTFRLISCWPFPETEIRELAERVQQMLVLENNRGQLYPYIRAEAAHACQLNFLGPQTLGQLHDPQYVLAHVKRLIK
jgi:2-oxoglutarate ferredoxin oxidoreductase subunit alpha